MIGKSASSETKKTSLIYEYFSKAKNSLSTLQSFTENNWFLLMTDLDSRTLRKFKPLFWIMKFNRIKGLLFQLQNSRPKNQNKQIQNNKIHR